MYGKDNFSTEAPEKAVISILVADIVGSTSIISSMDPEDSELFLNKCFLHIQRVVKNLGGRIINFSGDGAIAVFGWPLSLESHADMACRAAKTIVDSKILDSEVLLSHMDVIQFRVGVHSGSTIVRQIKTDAGERLDAIGSTVHVAAALQKIASPSTVVFSEQTKNLCRMQLNTTLVNLGAKDASLIQQFIS